MQHKTLFDGTRLPVLGQGTWGLGGGMHPDHSQDAMAVQALRTAIDLGFTHIDTAERYGGGHTEELVGKATQGYDRSKLFIASKVWHITMNYKDTLEACHASLRRIGTEYLDLYLIHRPNHDIPLEETFRALNELVDSGKVRYLGVSNFNLEQMQRAMALSDTPLVTNQVPYNLHRRTYVANGVLQGCVDSGLLLTAYSPLDRGYLTNDPMIKEIAEKYGATPAQVALNWLVRQESVIALPMSTRRAHLEENLGALDLQLSQDDVVALDHIELPEERLWPV